MIIIVLLSVNKKEARRWISKENCAVSLLILLCIIHCVRNKVKFLNVEQFNKLCLQNVHWMWKYRFKGFVCHGRLARWRDWKSCDLGEAKEGLENELWRRWSNGRVEEWAVKWLKAWRMSRAHNYSHSRAHSQSFQSLHQRYRSFSYPSLALPTSQLILQPFRCFTYVTAHSPTLLSLLLRHRIFTYVTWRAAHGTTLNYKFR